MSSYRFARRSFMASVGAAFGLHALLRNLEAMAEGATSPPRFLMMHWPVGTLRARFLPEGAGTNFTISPILQPFEAAGLRQDMIILYGLSDTPSVAGGGGHEAGTVLTTTGAPSPGTRANGGEGDDAVAGGPSWDQIFLKRVPALQRPGFGYLNTLCDARVDSLETSTRCLSYSYDTQQVQSVQGPTLQQAIPLLPELSPARAYAKLFAGYMPGGSSDSNKDALVRALRARKSVLDYSLRELTRLRTLAPGSEAPKIELHAAAIRAAEEQLEQQIAVEGTGMTQCSLPAEPDPSLVGQEGSHSDYGNPTTTFADDVVHEQIGKAHAAIVRAAFQCDLIRVATFQWSPGTNHVSFKGLFPDQPEAIYMHHPISHFAPGSFLDGPAPTGTTGNDARYHFLCNVQTWYNQKTAEILRDFKTATDAFGGSLLDHTLVPFVTEVSNAEHTRTNKPALIFGGSKLGMRGGQFLNLSARPYNDLWLSLAQAYFGSTTPLDQLSGERFSSAGASVIPGLWAPPA